MLETVKTSPDRIAVEPVDAAHVSVSVRVFVESVAAGCVAVEDAIVCAPATVANRTSASMDRMKTPASFLPRIVSSFHN
jgi:hypothetical protein